MTCFQLRRGPFAGSFVKSEIDRAEEHRMEDQPGDSMLSHHIRNEA